MHTIGRILAKLTVLLAVSAIAVFVVMAFMRAKRDRALDSLYTQIEVLGYGELFIEALDPALAARLGVQVKDNGPPVVRPEVSRLYERLVSGVTQFSTSSEWIAAKELTGSRAKSEWTPQDWDDVRTLVDDHRDLLEDAIALAELGGPVVALDQHPRMAADLPHLPVLNTLADIIHMYACVCAHEGDPPKALESTKAMFQLAKVGGSGDLLMCRLHEFSILSKALWTLEDVAPPATLSDSQSAGTVRFLQEQLREDNVTATMVLEAAAHLNFFLDMQRGMRGLTALANPSLPFVFYVDETESLRVSEKIMRCTQLPYPEARPLLVELGRQIREDDSIFHMFTSMAMSGLDRFPAAARSSQMKIQLARVGLTVEAHIAREGSAPANLDVVTEILGGSVPHDPLTGKPFFYQPDGASFALYSVGMDLVDDGGKHHELHGDWVWRGVEVAIDQLPGVQGMPFPGLPGMGMPGLQPGMPGMPGFAPGVPPPPTR